MEVRELIQDRIIDLFKRKREIENKTEGDVGCRWDKTRALKSCTDMIEYNKLLLEGLE